MTHETRLVSLFGLAGLMVLAAVGATFMRTQQDLRVAVADKQAVEVAGPLKIDFNQEIAPGFATKIEPAVPGTWHWSQNVLGVGSVAFVPAKRFQAGENYKISISHLKRSLTGAQISDVKQDFKVQVAAGIHSFSPKTGDTNVSATPDITVKLSERNRGVRQLRGALTPDVPIKFTSDDDQTFVWKADKPLVQGTKYTFSLYDDRVKDAATNKLMTMDFTTATQPAITAARSGGHLMPGQTIDVVFDQPMKPDTSHFKFDMPGESSWADDHTFKFKPASLKPGEHHKYTVAAGTTSAAGGFLEADREFQIDTNGTVDANLTPSGGGITPNSPIVVKFDQAVDHASAEAHFGMTPSAAGKFSWSGNNMTYAPAGMAYSTKYSFQIAPGVTPSWGLPNTAALKGTFATGEEVIKLGVPNYKQTFPLSCELSSLRMVLAFRGITTTDYQNAQKVGYNPRPRDTVNNTWDNPDEMYVGSLTGKMNSTGYGVHSGPIAKAAIAYGRNAIAQRGVSPAWIAQQVHGGNPVIFWGHSTPAKADSWNTSSGPVETYVSAHARVIYGTTGPANDPTGFYINDPMGSQFYWTAAQLSANMNVMGNVSNQVVVVY